MIHKNPDYSDDFHFLNERQRDNTFFLGGSKAPTAQKVTQEVDPTVKPFLERALEESQAIFETGGPDIFPDRLSVSPAPETLEGLEAASQLARGGAPLTEAAQQELLATIQGERLQENPALQGAISAATRGIGTQFAEQTLPAIQAGFSRAGRFGSGAQQEAVARAVAAQQAEVGDVASELAFRGFESERGRQFGAIGAAPQLEAAGGITAQRLATAGGARESLQQIELEEALQRFQFEQNRPSIALDDFISRIGGVGPLLGSTQSTVGGGRGIGAGNKVLGGLGGAATGLGLAGSLGSLGILGAAATGPVGIGLALAGALAGASQ